MSPKLHKLDPRKRLRLPLPEGYERDYQLHRQIRKVPGAQVHGTHIVCWPDALPALRAVVGRAPVRVATIDTTLLGGDFLGAKSLRGYQDECSGLVAEGLKKYIHLPCGTGKTAIMHAAAAKANWRKVLAVTGSSGRKAWQHDAAWVSGAKVIPVDKRRFDPDKSPSQRGTDLGAAYEEADIVAINYELLPHRLEELGSMHFDAIFWDEAHRVKGSRSRQAKAALELSRAVKFNVGSSATPVRDRRRDLLMQMEVIMPGRFGDNLDGRGRWDWLVRYAGAHEAHFGWHDTGPNGKCCRVSKAMSAELAQRWKFYAYRRTKRELAPELPAKVRKVHRMAPTAKTVLHEGAGLEAALRAAAGVKTKLAVELALDSLAEQEKIIVVTGRNEHVRTLGSGLRAEMSKLGGKIGSAWFACVTGEDSRKVRFDLVDQYMEAQGPAVFVTGYDWFAEELNMQDTDQMVICQLPWTYGRVDQLEGRVHRLGMSRPVTYHYIVAEGTVDEEIERLVLSKMEAVEGAGLALDGMKWDHGAQLTREEVLSQLHAFLGA